MMMKEDVPLGGDRSGGNAYPYGKTYLLIIAIDDYKNGIAPLYNAVKDARKIAAYLKAYYEVDEIKELVNQAATKQAILDVFDHYHDLIEEQDNFVFYFSGHGTYHKKTKKGYWLTADAETEKRGTFLPNDEVISFIRNLKARHIFGMVDSCFSEALFSTKGAKPLSRRYHNFPSRWLLTAGRLEPVSDGRMGDHSPFAKAILSYLESINENYLSVKGLCSYVEEVVDYNAAKQTPRGEPIPDVGHGGGEFFFLKKGKQLPQSLVEVNIDDNHSNKSTLPEVEPLVITNNTIENNINALKEELEELIINNEWKKAFSCLKEVLTRGKRKVTLINLMKRYASLRNRELGGTSSRKKIQLEYNQMGEDMLSFIDDLEQKDLK